MSALLFNDERVLITTTTTTTKTQWFLCGLLECNTHVVFSLITQRRDLQTFWPGIGTGIEGLYCKIIPGSRDFCSFSTCGVAIRCDLICFDVIILMSMNKHKVLCGMLSKNSIVENICRFCTGILGHFPPF